MDFKGLELIANGTVPYGLGVMCNAQGQFLAMMDFKKITRTEIEAWETFCKKVYLSPKLYSQLKKTYGRSKNA